MKPGEADALGVWLQRLEARNEARIELGLERVRAVLARLPVKPPPGRIFMVAGTNGKGSTVGALDSCLRTAGLRTGRYTSPHLQRYTERMAIAGREIDPASTVAAFATVEAAAGETPLTYFEFGTLAAFVAFSSAGCDAWVLEVGLGGRLDAVNALDPDWSLITTIGLDHQEYLGDTLDAIAGEKAGILRPGRPAFYGDTPVPVPVAARAAALGTPLARAGSEFGWHLAGDRWSFWTTGLRRDDLPRVPGWTGAQYRNASLALAALAAANPAWVPPAATLVDVLLAGWPAGRFQRLHRDGREWILDVAHNPQAARVLAEQLASLPPAPTTAVVALLADKPVVEYVAKLDSGLAGRIDCWVACGLPGPRGVAVTALAEALAAAGAGRVVTASEPADACRVAARLTAPGGRIVVAGSFRLVGPAREWLGLY